MNKKEFEFTGERLTTGIYEYWSLEHLHRYALAMTLVHGERVLDIASGEGYGTYLLSENAISVIGVDISEAVISHASHKYQSSNLSFKTGSISNIPLDDNSVDVVVSFETIEHHDEHDKMMKEIKRVLKPEGKLVISSPDKKFYSDIPDYKNPYHVKELYSFEFEQLIEKYFANSVFLKQKTIFGSVISSTINESAQMVEFSGDYSGIVNKPGLQDCPYILCIATDNSLENFSLNTSVFSNNDIFNLYSKLKDESLELEKRNKVLVRKLNNPAQFLKQIIKLPIKAVRRIMISKL
jgi:ubiquinone/menaquinone biosynthesis C-methylase UbiE